MGGRWDRVIVIGFDFLELWEERRGRSQVAKEVWGRGSARVRLAFLMGFAGCRYCGGSWRGTAR